MTLLFGRFWAMSLCVVLTRAHSSSENGPPEAGFRRFHSAEAIKARIRLRFVNAALKCLEPYGYFLRAIHPFHSRFGPMGLRAKVMLRRKKPIDFGIATAHKVNLCCAVQHNVQASYPCSFG